MKSSIHKLLWEPIAADNPVWLPAKTPAVEAAGVLIMTSWLVKDVLEGCTVLNCPSSTNLSLDVGVDVPTAQMDLAPVVATERE